MLSLGEYTDKDIIKSLVRAIEPLTATNYIKCIFEEFRWKDRKPAEIKIIPKEE
jgi:hypothetical protein